jgi:hypothetical protein
MRVFVGSFLVVAALVSSLSADGGDARPLIEQIKAVGKEGKGNIEAAKALDELVRMGASVLPEILLAMNDASPTASNWLRSAFETIAEGELKAGRTLATRKLEEYVADPSHVGTARRLAYEWLVRVEPRAAERLLPIMLDDPGQELRREAVARAFADARSLLADKKDEQARAAFLTLLGKARDRDQVEEIAKALKPLGVNVNLVRQFGFITRWHVAGPFDNAETKGFHEKYPPEKGVDLKAVYEGPKGEIRWKEHTTEDLMGIVDLNKLLGEQKGVLAYAFAEINSPEERPVELRVGSNNAVRLFLNRKEIYFRHEYHHGMRMDQHVGRGTLKKGRNEILVKVCQNEQTEKWATLWSFQARLCDNLGGAVPFAQPQPNRPGPNPGKKKDKESK